ncbi:MAG: hypothetical protein GY865_17550, partial [candidate division Zixibacteria bacterium]|nr:hypothetical protein [candidate division Zixibacteria bacterium]
MKRNILNISLTITLAILLVSTALGRSQYSEKPPDLFKIGSDVPYMTIAVHNAGLMDLTITNYGEIGTSYQTIPDPITGLAAPSLSYPHGLGLNYLSQGALWVGAIAGPDTLVTAGNSFTSRDLNEFQPNPYPDGDILFRSINDPEAPEYVDAVSNQDFIATYYDTSAELSGADYFTGEVHNKLGIKITQRSYSWGYDYAEDFIIFDYSIVNVGQKNLKDVYIGLYMDNDCSTANGGNASDDICGFLKSAPSRYIDGLIDTVDVVWAADNDADPNAGGIIQGDRAPTSAIGTKILRTPSDEASFSFNWWASNFNSYDWGPRREPEAAEQFRPFLFGLIGTPLTDKDKYYMMSQNEFDYNQEYTRNDHS